MITVVLIGTGNVAQNLFQGFSTINGVRINQVVGRNLKHLDFANKTTQVTTDFNQILPADIYILAVSDDAIPLVSNKLKDVTGIVVHTSGGTSMAPLNHLDHYGVFYPLQTFTKGKIVPFNSIPICIEASSPKDLKLLKKLGRKLSDNVTEITSKKRSILHISAVFANNFSNYMYTIAEDICKENKLDFDLLKPLINETAVKLNDLSAFEAQTGPAKRGDQQTLHTHLSLLKNKTQRELYTLLSNAIKDKHGKKL